MSRSNYAATTFEPLSAINTTPMIDVMLVLIIMMIMSLPAPTHEVAVDLPTSGTSVGVPPPVHRLTIAADGHYFWDGASLAAPHLPSRLAAFQTNPAAPVLYIETGEAAPYDLFDRTMAMIKRAGIRKIGFVGNTAGF